MYWASVVAPVIDAGKAIIQCITDGIEKGRVDVRQAKEQANRQYFDDENANYSSRGCSVAYDKDLFRQDDTK